MHRHTFISIYIVYCKIPYFATVGLGKKETCMFILFILYYTLILTLPLYFSVPIHQIQIVHYIRTYTLLSLFFHI